MLINFRSYALMSCVLVLLGCKTAPVTSTSEPAQNPSSATNRVQRPVPLDQTAFSVVATTNQLDAQWLRAPTNLFRLGPGDVLDIEILGEATSRSTVTVGPDGKIYFGLLPGTF